MKGTYARSLCYVNPFNRPLISTPYSGSWPANPSRFTTVSCSIDRSLKPLPPIHLTKLAAAAAAARSGLPLPPRGPVPTLANVDVSEEVDAAMAACDARFAVRAG